MRSGWRRGPELPSCSASRPAAGLLVTLLASLLAGLVAGLAAATTALAQPVLQPRSPNRLQPDPIVGRWVSVSGNEQVEIKANGYVRTCFVGNKPGSASMGAWSRTPQGAYRVEFSHAVTPRCGDESRLLRRYELSIIGNATANRNELALYLSGEFPPDRFVRAPDAAR